MESSYLYFPEITFEAAHYIPDYPGKCARIHGHTYFVRNLKIDISQLPIESDEECMKKGVQGISIDFGEIKKYFEDKWDHKFIVPESAWETWQHILPEIRPIGPADGLLKEAMDEQFVILWATTAEAIAGKIHNDLMVILKSYQDFTPYKVNRDQIHFELWEGPHQAVVC